MIRNQFRLASCVRWDEMCLYSHLLYLCTCVQVGSGVQHGVGCCAHGDGGRGRRERVRRVGCAARDRHQAVRAHREGARRRDRGERSSQRRHDQQGRAARGHAQVSHVTSHHITAVALPYHCCYILLWASTCTVHLKYECTSTALFTLTLTRCPAIDASWTL